MDAQSVIIKCLFPYTPIKIHRRSLLKSHTGLITFLQLQISQTHVKVSILSQSILGARSLAQTSSSLRIDTHIIIAHTQLIHGFPVSVLRRLTILLQLLDSPGIIIQPISCLTGDPMHLRSMFLTFIRSKPGISQILCLTVISLDQINISYIIRCENPIGFVCFHFTEAVQRMVIATVHIINIGKIIYRIVMITGTCSLQDREPDSSLFQIADLHISCTQAHGTFIPFFFTQHVNITTFKSSDRLQVFSFKEPGRSY